MSHEEVKTHTTVACLPAIDENVALIIDEMVKCFDYDKNQTQSHLLMFFFAPQFSKKKVHLTIGCSIETFVIWKRV